MIINISKKKVIILELDEEDMDKILNGEKLVRPLCDSRCRKSCIEEEEKEIQIYCSNPKGETGD